MSKIVTGSQLRTQYKIIFLFNGNKLKQLIYKLHPFLIELSTTFSSSRLASNASNWFSSVIFS